MDNDKKFWLRIWLFVLIGFLGICFCTATPIMYADYKIAEAIKSGANPIEVKYALRQTSIQEDVLAWMSKIKKD